MFRIPDKSPEWDRVNRMAPLASTTWWDIQERQRRLPCCISPGDTFHSPLQPLIWAPTFLLFG